MRQPLQGELVIINKKVLQPHLSNTIAFVLEFYLMHLPNNFLLVFFYLRVMMHGV